MNEEDALFENLNEYNYNPLNDVLFKFIFGKEERKQITIDFLNAVLNPSLVTSHSGSAIFQYGNESGT